MAESVFRRGLNWLMNTFHPQWLEVIADVNDKESAGGKEPGLEGFIPITNPATNTLLPLPISTQTKEVTMYFLHLDFLGLKARMPVSKKTFDSVSEGDHIKLKYQLGRGGEIKAVRIAEIIKDFGK